MHTVARYDRSSVKAKGQSAAIAARIFDSDNDRARFSFPDLSKFTAQAEVYTSSPWVNIAIDLIASSCALVNLNIYQRNGAKKERADNHPFETLMRRPNTHMTQYEFIYALITARRLTGNAYIYLVSDSGGAPNEMLLLRPDCVRIVPGTNGRRIDGYVYEVNGADPIPLAPEQVIHWKRYHPLDPYYGLSDIQVIALSVQADKGMSQWQAKFFAKENAVPAGIVTIGSTVSNTDYDELKANWYRSYGGTNRATAIIRGNDVKYQPLGTNHVDMDFREGRIFEKEVILNKFGVPMSIFAVNANEANARAGMELLTSNVIWPEMFAGSQKLSVELLSFWPGDHFCEPDDIRVKDERAELQKLQAYAPYKRINEVREEQGLDPVEWGDLPAAGAAAAVPGSAFGKPQLDQTPQQIAAGKALEVKDFTTDAQRRWFFANNPGFAAEGSMPSLEPGASRETHRQALEKFAETSKNRVANHLWDKEMIKYDTNGQVVVDHEKTKAAARDLVTDTRDAQYPRDYLVNAARDHYGMPDANQQAVEGRINGEKAAHAQAVLLATHVGGVTLTDAQHRYTQSVAQGNYLKEKYSQYESGARGTLQGVRKPQMAGGRSEYSEHMRQVHRRDSLEAFNPGAFKDAPGAGDCYLLLSLANDPYLIAIQEALKPQYPYVDWEEPAEFHITLVYAYDADPRAMTSILPTGIQSLGLTVGPTGTFAPRQGAEAPDTQPVYLAVQLTPELKALQASLFAALNTLGLSLSDYSQPADWTPHITLGYMPARSLLPVWDATIGVIARSLLCSVDSGDAFNVVYITKSLPLDAAARRELDRFATFASKRLWRGETKAVNSFTFNAAPLPYQILARACGDIARDADDLTHMIAMLGDHATKSVRPAAQRVNSAGESDPLARQKAADARAIQAAFADHMAATQKKILAGVRHVNSMHKSKLSDDLSAFLAYFSDGFWADDLAELGRQLKALIHDAILHATEGTYKDMYMAAGVSLDQAKFNIDAAQAAQDWTDTWLKKFGSTNQDGTGAILQRWIASPDATFEDLVAAIQESHLFSPARSVVVAETEVTRAYGIGTYNAAADLADAAGVKMSIDFDTFQDLLPAHVRCRCWIVTKFLYDDQYNITGVTAIWHSPNDDVTCAICGPRDGQDVSTL